MQTRDLTDLFSLAGRLALITSGATGLGLAVAEGFVQASWRHGQRAMEAPEAGDPVAARAAMDAHMDQAVDIHRQAVLNGPG